MAQIEVDNILTVDWWWDEHEYRVPSRARMERERQAYEEAEREDREIEGRRYGDMEEPGRRVMDGKDRYGHQGSTSRRVGKTICARRDKEIPRQI